MSFAYAKTLALFLIAFLPVISCLEPVTSTALTFGAGALLSTIVSKVDYIFDFDSLWGETCSEKWIHLNYSGLEFSLENNLFGQHLVNMVVLKSLKAHTSKSTPKKALVMAFHGWTGSGKNYVSKIIAEHLYELGSKSKFVHWYIATHDFPHASEVEAYQERLRKEIPEFTEKCGQSLFIFDEIDKMVPGVIDSIAPFLDFHEKVNDVDYRKNIFVFLSNSGGSEITRIAFDFWLEGKERADITLRDIEPLINKGAFNEEGGLKGSKIIKKELIDAYVPFLPLEKSHVLECIKKELIERGQPVNPTILSAVVKQIIFYPSDFQLFSSSGCKKIAHKVDLFGVS